jgi:hypothetical protein
MEVTKWITGAQVRELLGFVGAELVLISGGFLSPHDPEILNPIPADHITKVKESWKYECSKGIEIRYDADLLDDRLLGPHVKEGIQFYENSRGRTPLGLFSGDDLRGFAMYPLMPAARNVSRSPAMAYAVRAMTGMVRFSFGPVFRMRRVHSTPSRTGICTSMRMRSKSCAA